MMEEMDSLKEENVSNKTRLLEVLITIYKEVISKRHQFLWCCTLFIFRDLAKSLFYGD